MNAKRCDRCGAFYAERFRMFKFQVFQFTIGSGRRSIDLCDDCYKKLKSFLTSADAEKQAEQSMANDVRAD